MNGLVHATQLLNVHTTESTSIISLFGTTVCCRKRTRQVLTKERHAANKCCMYCCRRTRSWHVSVLSLRRKSFLLWDPSLGARDVERSVTDAIPLRSIIRYFLVVVPTRTLVTFRFTSYHHESGCTALFIKEVRRPCSLACLEKCRRTSLEQRDGKTEIK